MAPARYLAGTACAVLLTTCCPSVWLTVTRRAPAPLPYLPIPKVTDDPIPVPPHYNNRFDILADCCTPVPSDASFYDDLAKTSIEYARAIQGQNAIWKRFGNGNHDRELGGPSEPGIKARVGPCLNTEGKQCSSIVFPAGTDKIVGATRISVAIKGETHDYAVQACGPAPDSDGKTQVDCDKTPERCGDRGLCHEYPGGTLMVLAGPLNCNGCTDNDPPVVEVLKPRLSTTALSFIHLSDVQLRDGDVTLDDPELSKRLHWIFRSFEYDPDEMAYGRYMVEGLFATINKAVTKFANDDPNRPAFVIHTGDLIDAGVTTEVDIVHALIDRFSIPFFNVIGNHDVLVFGNMLPPKTMGSNSDAGCVRAGSLLAPYIAYFRRHKPWFLPTILCTNVSDKVTLIASDTHARSLANFIKHLKDPQRVPSPALTDAGPSTGCTSTPDVATQPLTRDHGFDLNHDKGYYAFIRSLTLGGRPRRAFFIVLDSMDLLDREGGNLGRIRPAQFQWLSATLACVAPSDLVFLFAHHGLSDITIGDGDLPADRNAPSALEQLLVEHNKQQHNIIGFLFGHHHQHRICKDGAGRPRPTVCKSFYEIETASIVDYPQEGRVIRIKDAGAGLAFLELTTFGTQLIDNDEFSKVVAIEKHGAERDYCRTNGGVRCSEDLHPYRDDGDETNARLFFKVPGATQ